MKQEEVKIGMKVRIPITKSIGYLTIRDFERALSTFRSVSKQDFLYVVYEFSKLGDEKSYLLGINQNSGTSDSIDGYKIGDFEFAANDLINYETAEEFKGVLAGLASPYNMPSSTEDGYGLPFQKKDKDWEMGKAELTSSVPKAEYVEMSYEEEDRQLAAIRKLQKGEIQPLDYINQKDKSIGDSKSNVPLTTGIVEKTMKGLRYNEGKLDYTLMDLTALSPMVEVLEFGAKKYSRDNWKNGGNQFTLLKLLGSMLRHISKLLVGELYDEESSLSHIGHVACNSMFLCFYWNEYIKAKKTKKKSNFLDGVWKSGKK